MNQGLVEALLKRPIYVHTCHVPEYCAQCNSEFSPESSIIVILLLVKPSAGVVVQAYVGRDMLP